jgi:uncharacterized protein (TIGR03545 family)
MKRVIRWSYVVPRLGIVIFMVLLTTVLASPMAKWVTVRAGQAVTGAKVDVGGLKLSLLSGRLEITDAQFADPRSPLKNLLQFQHAVLKVDTSALTHKRLVIEEGTLHGIRFGGSRSSSGVLPELPQKAIDKQSHERAMRWLKKLTFLLGDQVVDQLESVRTARDLAHQWPLEYQAWEQRADAFGQRIDKLKQLVHFARENPLRHLVELQQIAIQTQGMAKEIELAKREMGNLNRRLASDKMRVRNALARDHAQVDQVLQLATLDAGAVSQYFLGDEYARYVMEAVRWVAWSKTYIDMVGKPPEPSRSRGQDILFQGLRAEPSLVVKRLGLTGIAEIHGDLLQFTGTLTDLSSSPRLHDCPTVLTMTIDQQDYPTKLRFVSDWRTHNPTQELTVKSSLPPQERALGNRDSLALVYSAGASETLLQVRFENGEMDGKWIIKQEGIELQPVVTDKLGGERLSRPLADGLSEIDRIEVTIAFSGPIGKPKIEFHSDFGRQLSVGLNRAVRSELSEQRDRVLQKARLVAFDEFSKLEVLVRQKQRQLLDRYTAQTRLLRDVARFSNFSQAPSASFIGNEARQQLRKLGIQTFRR